MVHIDTRPAILHRMRDNDSQPVELRISGVETSADKIELHIELSGVSGGFGDRLFNEVTLEATRADGEADVLVCHFVIMTRQGGVPILSVSSPDKLFEPVEIKGSSRTKGPGAFGRLSPHRLAPSAARSAPMGFQPRAPTPSLDPPEPRSAATPEIREEGTDPVEPVPVPDPIPPEDEPQLFDADVHVTPTSPPLPRIAPPERPPVVPVVAVWEPDSDEITPAPVPTPVVMVEPDQEASPLPDPEDPPDPLAEDLEEYVDDEPTDAPHPRVPPAVQARIHELFPDAPDSARTFSMDGVSPEALEEDLPESEPEPVPPPSKRFVHTVSDRGWHQPGLLLAGVTLLFLGAAIGIQLKAYVGQAPVSAVITPAVPSDVSTDLPPSTKKMDPVLEDAPDVVATPEPMPEPVADTRVCTDPKLLHGASGGPEPDGCFISGCQEGYASAWSWTGQIWQRCETYRIQQDDTSCVRLTDADGTSHTKQFKNGQWISARCRVSI